MAEERIYTIVVKKERIEVSREVYYAYHKARESERYQRQVAYQRELSLERFQEEGVNAEYQAARSLRGVEDVLILAEDIRRLYEALDELEVEERLLIDELFFRGVSEGELAKRLGISQQAVSKRKRKLLKQLREKIE